MKKSIFLFVFICIGIVLSAQMPALTLSRSANFELTPGGDHNFGRSVINYAMIQTYTMTNTGDMPLTVNSIELSDTTGFWIDSAIWLPVLVSPGDTLQFELWFVPREIGISYSTNILIDETSQPTFHAYLAQGTGSAPGPIITANINGAGTTNYGETIQTLPLLTIYNTGNYELLFSTGPLTAPWISMNPASGFVQTNESLTFELIFNSNGMSPQNDPYEGILSIITNDSEYPTFDLNMQMFVRNIDTFPFFVQFNELSFPPNGWTTEILNGAAGFEGTAAGLSPPCIPHSEPGMAVYTGFNSNPGEVAYLASPPIEAADNLFVYSVEFYMFRDAGMPGAHDKIEVYSNSTQDLEGTPVLMGTINRLPSLAPAEIGGTGWYLYSLNFTPNNTGISYIIFKAISDGGNDMYLDDMVFWKQPMPPGVYEISPGNYDFGRRPIGYTKTLNYTIYNRMGLPLTINSIGITNTDCYALQNVPLLPIELDAGDSLQFDVAFTPMVVDEVYNTSLLIEETSQPLHTYTISGSGTIAGPIITTSIASMYTAQETETTFAQPITIYNTGIGDLIYSIGTPCAPWLSLNPSSGVIPQGGSLATTLTIDTHGLALGNYNDVITLATNDPVFPAWQISVEMDVVSGTINADFSGSPLSGHTPLTVTFTDESTVGTQLPGTTITEWQWDFKNDGIIDSYVQNPPPYTYSQPGEYSVSLRVLNNLGMASTSVKTAYISATNQAPMMSASIEPILITEDETYGPVDLTTYFYDPDGDPLTFTVNGSTHITAQVNGANFTLIPAPDWVGNENVQFIATDTFGWSGSQIVSVTVNPTNDPPVFYIPNNLAFISVTSFTVNFADYITDSDTPISEISLLNVHSTATTSHIPISYTPNVPGALDITFSAAAGFTGFEDFSITVSDNASRDTTSTQFRMESIFNLVPHFNTTITTGYTGQQVHFTDDTLGNPNQWTWNFGDTNTSNMKNPVHTFLNPGVYNVSLTAANSTVALPPVSSDSVITMIGILAQPNVIIPQNWQIVGVQNQYNVFANVDIHPGSSLTIGNGVKVNVFDTTAVNVNGCLNATHATFRPIGIATWGGLRFPASPQLSHLTNCTIQNAINPVIIDGGNVQINNLSINSGDQLQQMNETAIKIMGDSSPILNNVGIINYSTGLIIEGNNARNRSTPSLTNIRISNGILPTRDGFHKTAVDIRGEVSPVINNMEINNCDYGITFDNSNSPFTTTPSIHGVSIINDNASYTTGLVGLSISGNIHATIDSLYIDNYNTGLTYRDYNPTSSTTPTLTNIRIRNSTNASRGTNVGVILENLKEIQFTNSDIDSMSTGIRIQSSMGRGTSTPTLTNIRVRNSTNASRFANTGVEINGYVSPQFNDVLIENYIQGLSFTGTGTSFRTTTPTLTNIRVRNSTNASRTTSVGIVLKDVFNVIATSDTIEGYSLGMEITNDVIMTTSTPTLTNIRVRNSTNASRMDDTAIYLGANVAGTLTNCLIEGMKTGVFLADGNQTVLRYNLIKNCGTGIKASGFNLPLPIEYNIFKLDTVWQNAHAWTYTPVSVQYNNWSLFHNTMWGYPVALQAINATVTFINNIVWDDADIQTPFTLTNSSVNHYYNDIRKTGGYEPESSNFKSDPLLVNPSNDDFHLSYDSPCIDAGDPSTPLDPDSTTTDIGVYYYLHKASFTPVTFTGPIGTEINFVNTSIGHDYPGTTYVWDLNNDGTVDATTMNWSHQFNADGVYDIKLKMTTGALVDSIIYFDAIVIGSSHLKVPQNVAISNLGDDIVLNWSAITETTNNQPVTVGYYLIYKSDTPYGVFDFENYTSGGLTEFTDEDGALETEGYYLIIGFAGTLPELTDYIAAHATYPMSRNSKLPEH